MTVMLNKRINSIPCLKDRFYNNFIRDINRNSKELVKDTKQKYPIIFKFKRDDHFFQRIEQRKIDKAKMGSLFKKLLKTKYCELLYLFNLHKDSMIFGYETKTLEVSYKDVNIIFVMFNDTEENVSNPHFSLMPITVLRGKDRFKRDFYIELT